MLNENRASKWNFIHKYSTILNYASVEINKNYKKENNLEDNVNKSNKLFEILIEERQLNENSC